MVIIYKNISGNTLLISELIVSNGQMLINESIDFLLSNSISEIKASANHLAHVQNDEIIQVTIDGIEMTKAQTLNYLDAINESSDDGLDKDEDLLITDLVTDPVASSKDPISMNYKSEIKDGIWLHPKVKINYRTGFVESVIWYLKDVNEVVADKKVLEVTMDFTTEINADKTNCALSVTNRSKIWELFTKSGNKSNNPKHKKIKPRKSYETTEKRRKEGIRRRGNIMTTAEQQVGTSLVLMGVATNGTNAEMIMLPLLEKFGNEFSSWKSSGRGNVYNDLQNDTEFAWLNVEVPTIGHPAQATIDAIIPNMKGMVIRDFMIEKLKANI